MYRQSKNDNQLFIRIIEIGFVPNLNANCGQRYTVLATEGLAEFERQQIKNKEALNKLETIISLQSGKGEPRDTKDRLVRKRLKFYISIVSSTFVSQGI